MEIVLLYSLFQNAVFLEVLRTLHPMPSVEPPKSIRMNPTEPSKIGKRSHYSFLLLSFLNFHPISVHYQQVVC